MRTPLWVYVLQSHRRQHSAAATHSFGRSVRETLRALVPEKWGNYIIPKVEKELLDICACWCKKHPENGLRSVRHVDVRQQQHFLSVQWAGRQSDCNGRTSCRSRLFCAAN